MRQILRILIGLIILCALVLVIFLITNRRGVQPEQHPPSSPPPQQSPQSQPSLPPQQSPPSQQQPQPAQPQQTPQRFPQAQPVPPSEQPSPAQDPKLSHARAVEDVRAAATSLEEYKTRTGAYPTTAQGLTVIGEAIKDPWGNDYIYQSPSTRNRESYDLFSAGPDHLPDTADDDWGESEEPSE